MSSALKSWREAATIILVSSKPTVQSRIGLKECFKNEKVVPGWPKSNDYDYRVLMMKRSLKSGFFPSAYVFPGGISDKGDFNLEWSSFLSSTNNLEHLEIANGVRPPMFTDFDNNRLSPVIGFRITAIRELFEECGILICRKLTEESLSTDELEDFRKEVNESPSSFLKLCKKYSVVPDVDCLSEWSNWLTPNHLEDPGVKNRRYDTAFYLAATDEYLISKGSDKREVELCQWVTPTSVNEEFEKCELFLPPPQIYELSRLANFTKFKNLREFAIDRQQHGTERWMPVRISTADGITACLPGDTFYPKIEDLDLYGQVPPLEVKETMEENDRLSKDHLNRFSMGKTPITVIKCNVANLGFPLPKPRVQKSSL
ncbi:unnamed protein product [Dimorphilus gyrociliatus]|uniref:Nudix hydrolase domain-containing protein n=1 Tax=Dimorphilus gyrociliatus TaxID=2664684 RepID=A0A7I8VJG0_9ANNE|nr:unnamed protein product [Dimorphilus gyrociliatus]